MKKSKISESISENGAANKSGAKDFLVAGIGAVVSHLDISERRQAEESLRLQT